jgi:flagellar hook protein FlgE
VDLSNEMANLITAQRAFEANSKIITTSNEVLQTLVQMKQS